jgi:hypothetical protein
MPSDQVKKIFLEPMLEDPNEFGLTNKEGTKFQKRAKQASAVPKVFATIFFGLLLDLLGRRAMISLNVLVVGLIIAYIPFSSPNLDLLFPALIVE